MAIDMDLVRSSLGRINKKGGGGNRTSYLLIPKDGETVVRILPSVHTPSMPFRELYFHFHKGKPMTISPLSFGNSDPIDEFATKLQQNGSKEDWVWGGKLRPAMLIYCPVLIRGREQEGVKFWGFNKTIYQQILNYIDDPDCGDITDLMNGRDIVIKTETVEGTKKRNTTVMLKMKQSVATEDDAVKELIVQQPTYEEIFKVPTYEELQAQFEEWLSKTEDEREGKAPESVTSPQTSAQTSAPSSQQGDSVSKAMSKFDEMWKK